MVTAMSPRDIGRIRIFLTIVGASSAIGAIYGFSGSGWPGLGRGAVTGLAIAALIAGIEIGFDEPIRRQVARFPLSVLLACRTLGYGLCIALGSAVGELLFAPREIDDLLLGMAGRDYVFSFAMALLLNVVLAISRLLGPGMLMRFLSGRYHRPRPEERIFLIIDLKGSTAIAARIGNTEFLRLLDQYFVDLARALLDHGGEIYRYVGDAMIATWTVERGLRRADCLMAALDARRLLAERAPAYEKEFGLRPEVRAALHAGPVVSGEIGDIKREIVYLGDGLNLTAKLEAHGKATGADLIVSTDLLALLGPLPAGIAAAELPPLDLGSGRQLGAAAITAPAVPPRRP